MQTIYITYGAIIFCSISGITLTKPFDEEKSFSDENKLNCMDSGENYDRPNQNSVADLYKPRSKFEAPETYSNKRFEYDKKRSATDDLNDDFSVGNLEKRQVGVVYREDRPVGILQPFRRSYRFIPVKEENDLFSETQDFPYNSPSLTDVDKREIENTIVDSSQLDGNYPSILTNFKIVNKLDKKRNYDAFTDENVRDLKATIRRLRSSNPHNSAKIEEELKNILDDMGLIEDEEVHGEKREVPEQPVSDEDESLEDDSKVDKERNKRDETCTNSENPEANKKDVSDLNLLRSDEKRNDAKNDMFSHIGLNKLESDQESGEMLREKRQKEEIGINKENSELVENLKDSGDLMISGNKSPLASSSEIISRDDESKESDKRSFDDEDDDYEKRVERQIQNKINSLKEEVKREIEDLKKSQNDDEEEDMQRKKRQVIDNLISEESDELNPAMNPDGELKPLIRKRRETTLQTNPSKVRVKRQVESQKNQKRRKIDRSAKEHVQEKNDKVQSKETEEGGELLDDSEDGTISKRQVYDPNYENYNLNQMLYERGKRSGRQLNDFDIYDDYLYNNYLYNKNSRLKRRNGLYTNKISQDRYAPFRPNQWRSRFRRRINENSMAGNQPQQLSDMSDLDLFGALPKNYDGELSRYKRV